MVDVLKDIYSYLRDRNLSPSLHVRLLARDQDIH